jgi:hypothetical protein
MHAPVCPANLRLHPSGRHAIGGPRSHLEEHSITLKIPLTGKCAELFVNLDELRSVDEEDRKVEKVIIFAAVPKEDVSPSGSRRQRHVTLLACVSAERDAMTPLLIGSTPIRDSLWSRGFGQNENVMVISLARQRSPAYVNEELLFEYILNLFIPDVDTVRSHPGLETETAILLIGSALRHTSPRILQKLGE